MNLMKKAFKINRSLHRDIGFLCVGLTLIYAISGIAVNHIDSWNPSYKIAVQEERLPAPLHSPNINEIEGEISIRSHLNIKSKFKSSYSESEFTSKYFFQDHVVTIDRKNLILKTESTLKRPFLFQANYLHLNHPKKYWTWIADIYAILLLYLALSGIFMVKGKKGALGLGGFYIGIGFLLPLAVLLLI